MAKVTFPDARIIIVDDEPANVLLLEQILENAGYTNLRSTNDPREVFAHFVEAEPDLILLDLMMPGMNGFDVIDRLGYMIPDETFLPILVLTADATDEAKRKALSGAATDFLTKPFDHTEVILRIRNLLATRLLHCTLNKRVLERTAQLAESQMEVLHRLAWASEFRDDDTGQHTRRVGLISSLLARELGLPREQVDFIEQAAPLHDVGKISISDLILLKPGRLTAEEFDTIKTHVTVGASLLSGGNSELVQMAERIAGTHHERWDGKGYPNGLAGEEIPIEGRILAIADVFDALTHDRPYKKAWPVTDAVAEIMRQSGTQFDPKAVDAFSRLDHDTLV